MKYSIFTLLSFTILSSFLTAMEQQLPLESNYSIVSIPNSTELEGQSIARRAIIGEMTRARKKKKNIATRQKISSTETSTATAISFMLSPAAIETAVSLFMDWDILTKTDKIAKVTALCGAAACIIGAWVRKSMQNKKINNGIYDDPE